MCLEYEKSNMSLNDVQMLCFEDDVSCSDCLTFKNIILKRHELLSHFAPCFILAPRPVKPAVWSVCVLTGPVSLQAVHSLTKQSIDIKNRKWKKNTHNSRCILLQQTDWFCYNKHWYIVQLNMYGGWENSMRRNFRKHANIKSKCSQHNQIKNCMCRAFLYLVVLYFQRVRCKIEEVIFLICRCFVLFAAHWAVVATVNMWCGSPIPSPIASFYFTILIFFGTMLTLFSIILRKRHN